MQQNPLYNYLQAVGFTREDIAAAEASSTSQGVSLMYALELLGKVHEHKILEAFAKFYQCPIVHLESRDIPANILALIPKDIAIRNRVIPIDKAGNNVILAMGNPRNITVTDAVRFKAGYNVRGVLASEVRLTENVEKYYGKMVDLQSLSDEAGQSVVKTGDTGDERRNIANTGYERDDGPVIKLVNNILLECITRRASDIHIEPYETFFRVRLRIDGNLVELIRPPTQMRAALTTRIKIMSKMKLDETRLPQDGAINIQIGERPVDFRVSSIPTIFGEKIVLRVLDKTALQVDMTKLGFETDDLKKFKESIMTPYGMVLVTGPTGSGKTTTLYSALSELNKTADNIMTAEDPVEYNLEGINQVQMKSEIGMTFAAALRSFLRQDPDVIMVGEVRDLETAEISIKAALTGHMVLSTLHTNSAAETISRLLNMGIEPFNLSSALVCIVAQRLMRLICTKCKIVDPQVMPEHLLRLGIPQAYVTKIKAYKGAGCSACGNSGTRGRIAVHEVMKLNDPVRQAILEKKSAMEIKKIAMASGMRSLRQSALNKMAAGMVSINEVTEVTVSDLSSQDENIGDVA